MDIFKHSYWTKTTQAAPLAVFRVLFGLMMLISIIRFWLMGWIDKLYIDPSFFFSYQGFEWVKPLGSWTYLVFIVCGASALFVALGYRYRLAIILFFLSFTYIELMDKTTYLNHYYFVSLVSFIMIFLPANAYFSMDASRRNETISQMYAWQVDAIKLMLGIVYFYAGLAKINSDWLLHAMPLKIWLPSHYDVPLLGQFLHYNWVQYGFSWIGVLYDLSIPFLLLNKKTRIYAFGLVVVFHVLTRVLFPIGMFPYIMILSTLIFFDPSFHQKVIDRIRNWFALKKVEVFNYLPSALNLKNKWAIGALSVFFALQLLLPFRSVLYPGELFWTEQGFRFSWRVMLMEKAGAVTYRIKEPNSGKTYLVNNQDYLTSFQEKQMSFQPDFILEFAQYLHEVLSERTGENVEVYADAFVALNGRRSTRYVDPDINLAQLENSIFIHKDWILPFEDEIKGL